MALYQYTVIVRGRKKSGFLRATSLQHLSVLVKKGEGTLLKAVPYTPHWTSRWGGKEALTVEDLSEFFHYLALLERSGVPLDRALETLFETFEKPALKVMVAHLLDALEEGIPLFQAFQGLACPYRLLLMGLLKAGDKIGDSALYAEKAKSIFDQVTDFKKKMVRAVAYPLGILGVTIFLMGVLLFWVMPQFKIFWDQMGLTGSMPLATRSLIALAEGDPLLIFLGACFPVLALILLLGGARLSQNFSLIFHSIVSRHSLGRLYFHMELSLGLLISGHLLRGGLDLVTALAAGREGMSNLFLQQKWDGLSQGLQNGRSVSSLAASWKGLPPIVVRLVQMGEETGRLENALESAGEYLKQETDHRLTRFLNLVKPLLLLIVGGILLWLTLAFFLPMYDQMAGMEGSI